MSRSRAAIVFLALYCATPALGIASSWRISFEPQPAVFRKSDPEKIIFILLKNVSSHEAWVWESNALADYDLTLTDPHGKPVPMTVQGLSALEGQRSRFFRNTTGRIPVNSSYKNFIELSAFYDLSPGHYVDVNVRLRTINQDNYDWEAQKDLPQPEQDVPTGSTPLEIKP